MSPKPGQTLPAGAESGLVLGSSLQSSVSWDAEGLPPNGCHETALTDSLDVLIRSLSAPETWRV